MRLERAAVEDPGVYPEVRARRASVYGIVAVAQIPLVHFSVVWWRGLHQPPTVLRPGDPQIDTPLLGALLAGLAAFAVVYVWLLVRRVQLANIDAELEARNSAPDVPLAGEAVSAPDLSDGGVVS